MWLAGGLAVVAAGIVVVALAFFEDGRRRVRPSHRGTVTAQELRAADLPTAWRGYDRGHVEALLSRAAQTLEEVHRYGTVEVAEEDDRPRATPRGAPPSFLQFTEPDDSGEELEDGGGDGTGGLDR